MSQQGSLVDEAARMMSFIGQQPGVNASTVYPATFVNTTSYEVSAVPNTMTYSVSNLIGDTGR